MSKPNFTSKVKAAQKRAKEATQNGESTFLTADEIARLSRRTEPTLAEIIAAREAAKQGPRTAEKR